jgi:uncharacterized phage protein (TIGR02220 family)
MPLRSMPNRIVREGIITSESVNTLAWPEEVFYRRLHSVVDDYGRFHANLSLIRAACYPLRLNDVSDQDVGKWLAVCATKGLVRVYEVEGKRFLEVAKFAQQVRAKASKFPQPPDDCAADATQTTSTSTASAHLVVVGDGVVSEGDITSGKNGPTPAQQAKEILNFLNEKTGRSYEPLPANLNLIIARLKEGSTALDLRQVVAKKCREWIGDEKMAEYLRPKTLFNATNFAQYKGELVNVASE